MPETCLELFDNEYPSILKNIDRPPQKLFLRGNMSGLFNTCIAIVGTRRHSEYGAFMTKEIVKGLSGLEISIVSGLAKGIDSIAHREAMNWGLKTIAVLGSGLDNIYPRVNKSLAAEIVGNGGLILSEHPANTGPRPHHFPMRNRIISGLSVATIVIEAGEKSGALITARYALDQGRDIFTVPADIDKKNSLGPLRLLQNGAAYPIGSARDIIDYLRSHSYLLPSVQPIIHPETKSGETNQILNCLNFTRPLSCHHLLERSKMPIRELLEQLSILEIKGIIENKNGKYLRKC